MNALNVLYNITQDHTHQIWKRRTTIFESWSADVLESLQDYPRNISRMDCLLRRIKQCTNCSDRCFVMSHIYLNKLLSQNSKLISFNEASCYLLVYTSVLVAMRNYKLPHFDWKCLSNEEYGNFVGLSGYQVFALYSVFVHHLGTDLHLDSQCISYHQVEIFRRCRIKNKSEPTYIVAF